MSNKWLADLRTRNDWTQEKVAEMIKVDRSYIAKIEAGQVPSVKIAKRLGRLFNVQWQNFFEENCDVISHTATGTEGQ